MSLLFVSDLVCLGFLQGGEDLFDEPVSFGFLYWIDFMNLKLVLIVSKVNTSNAVICGNLDMVFLP